VGRQIHEEDVLLVDVPEKHAKRLAKMSLTTLEQEILDELLQIHRREDHFWGR
jgi:translation initiation factor 5B